MIRRYPDFYRMTNRFKENGTNAIIRRYVQYGSMDRFFLVKATLGINDKILFFPVLIIIETCL
ncbi:MAG: hypothetical protein C0403_00970 [Desulfobacterium sp.]|nr:hypothetical protein [Desulfobacterium sp.]